MVPKGYLQKDYRLPMIIQEIEDSSEEVDGKKKLPALILLQEVDMLDDIYTKLNSLSKEVYGEFEYSYEFIPKAGDHNDGLCLFYDTEMYKELCVKKDHYRGPLGDQKSNRVYLMILFEHIETRKKLIAWTLHFKSKPQNRKIRAREVTEYMCKLGEFWREIEAQGHVPSGEGKKLPIIVAGDFNDEPDSPIVQSVFDTDISNEIKFSWAYQVDGEFPDYTTYKIRIPGEIIKHTIDYVFFNDFVKVKSIREMPKEEDIPEIGNPCHKCSSDHFSSAVTFEF